MALSSGTPTFKMTEKIERVQRQSVRFITNNYYDRSEGCVTRMLKDLELPPLQDRRRSSRLIFLYKVIEGMVPAIQPDEYIQPAKNKRQVKVKTDKDFKTTNIIERYSIKNNSGLKVKSVNTEQYKNSCFIKTVVDWNHLDNNIACAQTIEGFDTARPQCY